MRPWVAMLAIVTTLPLLAACAGSGSGESSGARLEVVAESSRQWTGVAVAPGGRVFVCFPRWSRDVPTSVAEVMSDGTLRPFPDAAWNSWKPGDDPAQRFVCVQSVFVDDQGSLWILDPANPRFEGVVTGGPKLCRVDLARNEVVEVLWFPEPIAPAESYLNDVRVDTRRRVAYVTDSGLGALLTVDLDAWSARRVLQGHRTLRSEGIDIVIQGKPWRRGGRRPEVHADGIALSPDRQWLYVQALTSKTLYRVPTAALLDESLDASELSSRIQRVVRHGPVDGIAFGRDGSLYLSSLETSSVKRWTRDGKIETVVADPRLAWPDSFAVGPDGWIYLSTSQIHRGASPGEPYRVFRFRPPGR